MLWKDRQTHRNPRLQSAWHPLIEALENRRLLTVLAVNSLSDAPVNLNDSTVTLRDAIQAANFDVPVSPGGPRGSGADDIRFSSNLFFIVGSRTISLVQSLGQLQLKSDVTVAGPGSGLLTIRGTSTTRVFDVTDFSSIQRRVTISGLTISGGNAPTFSGGGILNREFLTVKDCTISFNNAGVDGGAIFNVNTENSAVLTVQNCTITSNSANGAGGGIRNSGGLTVESSTIDHNTANSGGGIRSSGAMTVRNSTLSANTSNGSGAGINSDAGYSLINSTLTFNIALSNGGGIFGTGTGSVSLSNSTFSGNKAFADGGGIYNVAPLTLRNCTITQNHADTDNSNLFNVFFPERGGGIFASSSGSVTMHNTIVTDNFRGNANTSRNDIIGTVNSASTNNLIGSSFSGGLVHGVNGNLVGITTPVIGPLTNNGGPTLTHAPLLRPLGKSVINFGNNAQAAPGGLDQRGSPFKRLAGGTVDIGAVEAQLGGRPVDLATDELDDNQGKGDLSLREAIELANIDADADTISFDPAIFSTPRTITLTQGAVFPLGIFTSVIIAGPGANLLSISGNNTSTVFSTGTLPGGPSSNIIIRGVTIFGGKSANGLGSGIANNGNLTVQSCNISGNTAGTSGGGIFNTNTGNLTLVNSTLSLNRASNGAGIFNNGTLIVRNSTLSGNLATNDGGGILNNGTLSIQNSTLTQNRANSNGNTAGLGGGLRAATGTATLGNTIVAANFNRSGTTFPDDIVGTVNGIFNLIGTGGSGGLINGTNSNQVGVADPKLGPLASNGGTTQTHALLPGSPAIDAASEDIDVTDQRGTPFVRVAGAALDVGAYELQSLNLAVNIMVDEDDGRFGLQPAVDVEDADLSLREAIHLTNDNPGADTITFDTGFINFNFPQIMVLTRGNLVISDDLVLTGPGANLLSLSGPGGGVFSQIFHVNDFSPASMKTVNISGLTIAAGNSASVGGGLTNFENLTLQSCAVTNNRAATDGAGISNFGTLSLLNCLVNGNSAGARGGGIFNEDKSTLTIQNSTVTGNSAATDGGGIFTDGTLTIESSTIARNVADSNNDTLGAGGGIFVAPSFVTLHNTIVAENFRGAAGTTENDISTVEALTVNSASANNLIGTGGSGGLVDGVNGNLIGVVDPGLFVLGNNGGPTRTIGLLPTSPAIDAADPANFPATDQRGTARPQDHDNDGSSAPDIGAFELRADDVLDTGPSLGTFDFAPLNAFVAPRQPVNFVFSWTVPFPENWHNLEWLQLRIRDDQDTILWLKFDESSNTFSISKHADGEFDNGFAAGTDKKLNSSAATLYLAESSVVASGPTSPTVTLNLSLSFNGSAVGRSFIVEVAAKNDQGELSGFEQAGELSVTREQDPKQPAPAASSQGEPVRSDDGIVQDVLS